MIISIVNTKGGSGKSTAAINIAAGFANFGFDVLLIDTDEEGTSLAWSENREGPTENLTIISIPKPQAFKNAIPALAEKHQLIIIDGAPHLTEMLTITVAVSQLVIIPVIPSPNDIWKLQPLINRIELITDHRQDLQTRFLINNFVAHTNLSKEVGDALAQFEIPVFNAKLSTRMDYRDSLAQGSAAIEFTNPKARHEISLLLQEIGEIANL